MLSMFNSHVRELISTNRLIVEANTSALRYANTLFQRSFPPPRPNTLNSQRNFRNNPYLYSTRRSRSRNNSDDLGVDENNRFANVSNMERLNNRRNDNITDNDTVNDEPTTPPPTIPGRGPPPPPPRPTRNIRFTSRTTIPFNINTENQQNGGDNNTRVEDLMFPDVPEISSFLPSFMENMERLAGGGSGSGGGDGGDRNEEMRQNERENRLREFFINATLPFINDTQAGEERNTGMTTEEIESVTTTGPYRLLRPSISPAEQQLNPVLDSENNVTSREADRCPITWTQFSPNTEIIRIDRCGHMFTPVGLTQWLERHNTCPTCRAELTSNTEDR
ncbi:MAG: hypothetical protein CMM25_08755, partial [Rhodospirillaceae bacterium]|nr:hypothetical protein [Rhodospirillaceae bacterium]